MADLAHFSRPFYKRHHYSKNHYDHFPQHRKSLAASSSVRSRGVKRHRSRRRNNRTNSHHYHSMCSPQQQAHCYNKIPVLLTPTRPEGRGYEAGISAGKRRQLIRPKLCDDISLHCDAKRLRRCDENSALMQVSVATTSYLPTPPLPPQPAPLLFVAPPPPMPRVAPEQAPAPPPPAEVIRDPTQSDPRLRPSDHYKPKVQTDFKLVFYGKVLPRDPRCKQRSNSAVKPAVVPAARLHDPRRNSAPEPVNYMVTQSKAKCKPVEKKLSQQHKQFPRKKQVVALLKPSKIDKVEVVPDRPNTKYINIPGVRIRNKSELPAATPAPAAAPLKSALKKSVVTKTDTISVKKDETKSAMSEEDEEEDLFIADLPVKESSPPPAKLTDKTNSPTPTSKPLCAKLKHDEGGKKQCTASAMRKLIRSRTSPLAGSTDKSTTQTILSPIPSPEQTAEEILPRTKINSTLLSSDAVTDAVDTSSLKLTLRRVSDNDFVVSRLPSFDEDGDDGQDSELIPLLQSSSLPRKPECPEESGPKDQSADSREKFKAKRSCSSDDDELVITPRNLASASHKTTATTTTTVLTSPTSSATAATPNASPAAAGVTHLATTSTTTGNQNPRRQSSFLKFVRERMSANGIAPPASTPCLHSSPTSPQLHLAQSQSATGSALEKPGSDSELPSEGSEPACGSLEQAECGISENKSKKEEIGVAESGDKQVYNEVNIEQKIFQSESNDIDSKLENVLPEDSGSKDDVSELEKLDLPCGKDGETHLKYVETRPTVAAKEKCEEVQPVCEYPASGSQDAGEQALAESAQQFEDDVGLDKRPSSLQDDERQAESGSSSVEEESVVESNLAEFIATTVVNQLKPATLLQSSSAASANKVTSKKKKMGIDSIANKLAMQQVTKTISNDSSDQQQVDTPERPDSNKENDLSSDDDEEDEIVPAAEPFVNMSKALSLGSDLRKMISGTLVSPKRNGFLNKVATLSKKWKSEQMEKHAKTVDLTQDEMPDMDFLLPSYESTTSALVRAPTDDAAQDAVCNEAETAVCHKCHHNQCRCHHDDDSLTTAAPQESHPEKINYNAIVQRHRRTKQKSESPPRRPDASEEKEAAPANNGDDEQPMDLSVKTKPPQRQVATITHPCNHQPAPVHDNHTPTTSLVRSDVYFPHFNSDNGDLARQQQVHKVSDPLYQQQQQQSRALLTRSTQSVVHNIQQPQFASSSSAPPSQSNNHNNIVQQQDSAHSRAISQQQQFRGQNTVPMINTVVSAQTFWPDKQAPAPTASNRVKKKTQKVSGRKRPAASVKGYPASGYHRSPSQNSNNLAHLSAPAVYPNSTNLPETLKNIRDEAYNQSQPAVNQAIFLSQQRQQQQQRQMNKTLLQQQANSNEPQQQIDLQLVQQQLYNSPQLLQEFQLLLQKRQPQVVNNTQLQQQPMSNMQQVHSSQNMQNKSRVPQPWIHRMIAERQRSSEAIESYEYQAQEAMGRDFAMQNDDIRQWPNEDLHGRKDRRKVQKNQLVESLPPSCPTQAAYHYPKMASATLQSLSAHHQQQRRMSLNSTASTASSCSPLNDLQQTNSPQYGSVKRLYGLYTIKLYCPPHFIRSNVSLSTRPLLYRTRTVPFCQVLNPPAPFLRVKDIKNLLRCTDSRIDGWIRDSKRHKEEDPDGFFSYLVDFVYDGASDLISTRDFIFHVVPYILKDRFGVTIPNQQTKYVSIELAKNAEVIFDEQKILEFRSELSKKNEELATRSWEDY